MTNKKYNLLFISIIFITGIIAYSNSFDCSFHFDDNRIFFSPVAASSASIGDWIRLFSSRPIGMLTFATNYYFHGLDVRGYHLVNLIIHLINALLVWWMTWLTLSTPVMRNTEIARHKALIAFLTGLLFVTHPLATQSVTYIVQRFTLLSTLFYLLSMILFVQGKFWRGINKMPWFLFGCSIVCAVLGILTKEIVFTLPFAILLYDYCFLETAPLKLEIKNDAFIISFIIFVIFIFFFFKYYSLNVFNTIKPYQGYSYSISVKEYFITQFSVILTYIRLLFLPFNQNFDYDYSLSTSFFQIKTFFNFSLLLCILATGVLLFKRYRLISFGIFWFFLSLSVESSVLPIAQDVIFEHRTYLPSFGLFLALTSAFFYFIKGKHLKIVLIIFLMISAINTALTYQRNKIWKNESTLWTDCLKNSPNKGRVSTNLGNAYAQTGLYQQAVNAWTKSIHLIPDYAENYLNRGSVYGKQFGQHKMAIEDFNNAIRLKPDYIKAYNNRGLSYYNLGQYKMAIEDFNNAIRLKSDYADAFNNRGIAFIMQGNSKPGCSDAQKACELGNCKSLEWAKGKGYCH
jgi:protein O-mannosyl-transferase